MCLSWQFYIIDFFPALEMCQAKKLKKVLIVLTYLDIQSHFSSKPASPFLFSRCHPYHFTCTRPVDSIILIELLVLACFFSEANVLLLILTDLDIQTHISPNYSPSFLQSRFKLTYFYWMKLFKLKIKDVVAGVWILTFSWLQKHFQTWNIPSFKHVFFHKTCQKTIFCL